MGKPPFRLAADCSAPYTQCPAQPPVGVDEPWAPCMLRKDAFLRDARRLLRQVAHYLPDGFTLLRVSTCQGGLAVGGDVYAYYTYAPGRAVCLCLGQTALDQPHRTDHIGCHAYTCQIRDPESQRIGDRGMNVWLNRSPKLMQI